jgi:hypothetical protein
MKITASSLIISTKMQKEVYSRLMYISIADLKRMGYLNGQDKCGVIASYYGDSKNSTYAITVKWNNDGGIIHFDYTCNGMEFSYSTQLIKVQSNLPSGGWFYRFKCVINDQNAAKLYFCNKRLIFVGRQAIDGKYYSQCYNWNGKSSAPFRYGLTLSQLSKVWGEISKKKSKYEYAGVNTKKYNRYIVLAKKINLRSDILKYNTPIQ